MKKAILLIGLVFLANCGGEELGTCGLDEQPRTLVAFASPSPVRVGETFTVVVQGTDEFCDRLPTGTPVHIFVNGFGFEFDDNGTDKIDVYMQGTGASTEMTATRHGAVYGMIYASVVLDGEIISAEPLEVRITQ